MLIIKNMEKSSKIFFGLKEPIIYDIDTIIERNNK